MKKNKKSNSSKKTSNTIEPITALKRTTNKKDLNENVWVVFRTGTNRNPLVFEGKLKRDHVRSAYSRITGATFSDTRSRRLKNY